jgi:hypothetical protein
VPGEWIDRGAATYIASGGHGQRFWSFWVDREKINIFGVF